MNYKNLNLRKKLYRDTFDLKIPFKTKLKLTRNIFQRRKAYIFAAGPSLGKVDIIKLQKELDDSLVICIKQSIDLVKEKCDLLLMNFCNFSDYDWKNISPPTVWSTFDEKHSEIISSREIKCNALLPVVENSTNNLEGLSKSTAGKESWDNLLRLEEERAIWGPGLMYELAIPFAINAGVKEIILVGWDIGTLVETKSEAFLNEHFYDNAEVEMKTKITNLEIEIVAQSTKSLKNWLASRDIKLSIISDRSLVHKEVTRDNKWLKSAV